MSDMTLEEVRAAIEADPDKLAFLKKICSLTEQQVQDFIAIWTRIQAGEDVDTVIAEWKEVQV